VKNNKIVESATTAEAREKISTNLGFLEFLMIFDAEAVIIVMCNPAMNEL
jgi:hypothetical protein